MSGREAEAGEGPGRAASQGRVSTHAVVVALKEAATLGLGHTGVSTEEEARGARTALRAGLGAVLRGLSVNASGWTAGHARVVVAVGGARQGCNGKGTIRSSKPSRKEDLAARGRPQTCVGQGNFWALLGVAHLPSGVSKVGTHGRRWHSSRGEASRQLPGTRPRRPPGQHTGRPGHRSGHRGHRSRSQSSSGG